MAASRKGDNRALEWDADADLEFIRDQTFSKHVVQQTILLDRALEETLPSGGSVHISRLAAAKTKSDIRDDRRSIDGIPAAKRRWLTEYRIRRTR